MAEHLEILRRALRRHGRIGDRARKALAFERHLRARPRSWPAPRCRSAPASVGVEVAGVDELVAQLALGLRCASARTSRRDRGCRRHGCSACSAAAACSTPSPSRAGNCCGCRGRRCRRCGGASPRSARAEVERPHRVDEAERPALLARAIVGHHDDQRVVAHAGRCRGTRSAAQDADRHGRACRQRPIAGG